jgi:hypothetical protein
MHRREPFDPNHRPIMYRAQTKETSLVVEMNASDTPHPRSRSQ